MLDLKRAAESWAADHGRYPMTRAELDAAAASTDFRLGESRFHRRNTALPFQLELAADSNGPVHRTEKPGVIYYAVNTPGQRCFITATTLRSPVTRDGVILLENPDGGTRLLAGEIAPREELTHAPKK